MTEHCSLCFAFASVFILPHTITQSHLPSRAVMINLRPTPWCKLGS